MLMGNLMHAVVLLLQQRNKNSRNYVKDDNNNAFNKIVFSTNKSLSALQDFV